MVPTISRPRIFSRLTLGLTIFIVVSLITVPVVYASHAIDGPDVKVIDDNNNVDGGLVNVTPSFDAQNRQSNEPTVSISGVASPVTDRVGDIIAAASNDYRMAPHFGDSWMPVYLSFDGGVTWFGGVNGFNTMIPGFPTDTSTVGQASPLKNLDGSGDPVVRFDSAGNLYIAGIAFNRNFDQPDKPVDTVVFVAKYDFTPGTSATASTTTTAGSPPHFTYAGTSIVERGAVGFALPGGPFGIAGKFVDKEWMEIDLNSPLASICAGSVYVSFTSFHGSGSFPIVFSVSNDGGASFSQPRVITTGGQTGTVYTQGSDIAVATDGAVYVAYRSFNTNSDRASIQVVKSTDCGGHWTQPVTTGFISSPQAPGVAFRTPTFAFVAIDDTDPDTVYVAYQNFVNGDYDIYVQRSTDGGVTWDIPQQVNTDPGNRHQIWPTIEVSSGAVHVAWYDFRNSLTPANEALDVYYACTNCDGATYPTFSHEVRVTDISHNGNCQMFGGGSVAFHGDYIELDARWDGSNHIVHIVWTDNRDVPPGECDLTPGGGATNNIGNRNQNIYTDSLVIEP